MISTQDNLKPEFSENESAWVSWMTGFADLNHDGLPEVIAGYQHEYTKGRGEWTRDTYQYGFYSTDPNFEHPSGTNFLAARTMLTQDFNGDGKDDVIFIQHGPDFEPFEPARNEILLSSPTGYSTSYMNGGASLFHGGAAGDFDEDGDIDVVTTPGPNNEISILLNDGSGRFTFSRRLNVDGRFYNVKTWDIDDDGHLDLLFDGHEEPLTILWGQGNGQFINPTVVSDLHEADLVQDAVFIDGDDGSLDIILVSSLSINQPVPYQGYSVDKITFRDREIISAHNIDKLETPNRNFGGWLNFIHACDLGEDGDMDVIFEYFSNSDIFAYTRGEWIFLDKLVWENNGSSFTSHTILNPEHPLIPTGIIPDDFFGGSKTTERLGVSLVGYMPNQTYSQIRVEQPFFQKHQNLIELVIRGESTVPISNWNSGAVLSDRARRILEGQSEPDVQANTSTAEPVWNTGAVLSDGARRILEGQSEPEVQEDTSIAEPVWNTGAVLSDGARRILEQQD
jgi:hypothetical protein